MASASPTGSYSAGALIPFTETFVQSIGVTTVTSAIPLVGQVLNNGATNFVGYNNGSAEYILPSSTSGAIQTTLADGNTYYISEGFAPAGYLYTTGGASSSVAVSTSTSDATAASSGTAASPDSTSSARHHSSADTTKASSSVAAQSTSAAPSTSPTTGAGVASAAINTGLSGFIMGALAVLGFLV